MSPFQKLPTRWAGPFVIAVAGAVMLRWTWGTWPDVLVDFGRELYVAWRLAEGDVLYSDIAYFNGPLSPYVNAFWFYLFGTSLQTLIFCNLAIVAALIVMLYRILFEISDHLAATTACLTFVTVFAFGQLDAIGNYNYVCPYSHEITHGLALSLGAILCLSSYLHRGKLFFISGAGFTLGLVFLTKAEIFLAAALAMMVGLGLILCLERPLRHRTGPLLWAFTNAAAIPPVVAFLLLSLALPAEQALRGTLGSWLYVFNRELNSLAFYQWGMGTLHPLESLRTILWWIAGYGVLFLPPAGLGLLLTRPGRYRIVVTVGVFVLVAAAYGSNWRQTNLFEATAPLPFFLMALGAITSLAIHGNRENPIARTRLILRMTMIALAFGLLGKIILNAQLLHYGFALTMLGTLLALVTLVRWVPDFITRRGGHGQVFQAASFALLLVAIPALLYIVNYRLGHKQYIVSNGPDRFIADGRGIFVNTALSEVAKRLRPDQSLAVFPEGAMLNYLSRRINPTPYINFMPPELIIFREERILDSFRKRPPDHIALVHKNTTEYGFPFFGRHYGQKLYAWIESNYQPIRLIGSPPLQNERFGILLLKRNGVP